MNAMQIFSRTVVVCGVLGTLGGCTPPVTKPVIEDHSHSSWPMNRTKVAVFSTTAARREVLVRYDKNSDEAFICAEAPPDTADAITSSLSLLAEAQLNPKATPESVNATLNLTKEIATSVSRLYTRSQGEQMFRDGAFHLCLALQNGVIEKADYITMYNSLMTNAKTLITAELPTLYANQTAPGVAPADSVPAAKPVTKVSSDKAAVKAPAQVVASSPATTP